MDKLINMIKEHLNDGEDLLAVITIGSQLLVASPKDYDYKIIVKNYRTHFLRTHIVIDEIKYDLLYVNEDIFNRSFDFSETSPMIQSIQLYNYMYEVGTVIYGELKLPCSLFEVETEYRHFLKQHYLKTIANTKVKWKSGKLLVHYYVILAFYENKTLTINQQMKADITLLYESAERSSNLVNDIIYKITNKKEGV